MLQKSMLILTSAYYSTQKMKFFGPVKLFRLKISILIQLVVFPPATLSVFNTRNQSSFGRMMKYKQPSVSYAPSLGRSWWHNSIVSILPDTISGPISPKLQMRGTRSIFDIFQNFQRIYGQNRLNFKKSHLTFRFGYLCAKRASTPHPKRLKWIHTAIG